MLTLDKDEYEADLSNYVLAARHHLGLTSPAAVSWVIDRISTRTTEMRQVACACLALPHANLEWICEADRYRPLPHGR